MNDELAREIVTVCELPMASDELDNVNDDVLGIVSRVTDALPLPDFVVYVPALLNPLLYENEIVVESVPLLACETVQVLVPSNTAVLPTVALLLVVT